MMKTSSLGRQIIKDAEGLRLKAYLCPAKVWTIGVGHTGGVKEGDVITEARADELLAHDLERFEHAVMRLCPETTQGQFDALTSFAFNLGEGALEKSTLRKLHNAGQYSAAANEFGKWTKAGGRELEGLVRRRAAEAKRYRSPA